MTAIVRQELLRMESLMGETDPRSIEYTQLMRNFEILANQSDMYDEVEALLSEGNSEPQEVTVVVPAFETVRESTGDGYVIAPSSECSTAGMGDGNTTDERGHNNTGAIEHDDGANIAGNSPPSVSAQSKELGRTTQETNDKGEDSDFKSVTVSPTATDTEAEAENHPDYKMEDVRAALVTARRKRGINVTELLREFGVDNFGSFPAGRYWELMQRLESDA